LFPSLWHGTISTGLFRNNIGDITRYFDKSMDTDVTNGTHRFPSFMHVLLFYYPIKSTTAANTRRPETHALPPLISSFNNNTDHHHHYYANVGVIDFYIPIPPANESNTRLSQHKTNYDDQQSCSEVDESIITKKYLPVRLLYPTHTPSRTWLSWFRVLRETPIPYLNVETAIEFCIHSMRFGAPKPLKQMDWILHTWRLITLPASRNVPLKILRQNDNDNDDDSLVSTVSPPKMVVFSHGLGGTMDLYSYQTMSLASAGYIVLSMTHTDGSAPIAPQPHPHRHIKHDTSLLPLEEQGKHAEYALARQSQNAIRTHEYLYAVTYVRQLLASLSSDKDHCEVVPNNEKVQHHDFDHHRRTLLHNWQISDNKTIYWNGVDNISTYFMGHSFGGATAIQAAYERPDLVTAIIAHEPAMGWAAPQVCHAMFPSSLLKQQHFINLTSNFTVCPSLTNDEEVATTFNEMETLHELEILVLNSHEWMNKT
jgi:Platelet-activating factor acetylhydrolase, isoform II